MKPTNIFTDWHPDEDEDMEDDASLDMQEF